MGDGTNGGGTLSVSSEDLKYFADTTLVNFIKELQGDPSYKVIRGFGGGGISSESNYDKLLAGYTNFGLATTVQKEFGALCKALYGSIDTLVQQLGTARVELKIALAAMERAHEEAITAAEMMEILNKVMGAGAPKPTTTP
ncbi:hypothetical protein [Kitasatospora sp. NPDC057223]|uniref:hypothetical protein n=1 Tax=Kitasatospora sp. NPDC057223 TaxID=3346055 RepID=UPI003641B688